MRYFLDTADIDQVKKWIDIIDGVTTNPHLLDKSGIRAVDFIQAAEQVASDHRDFLNVFVQIRNEQDFEQFNTFELARQNPDDNEDTYVNIIYKVSMHPNLFPIMKKLKEAQRKICATTIYDIVQLNQAIEMKFDYSMVYLNKNENDSFLEEALKYKWENHFKSSISLVAASFRSRNDVIRAIKSGIDYATVRPEHLELAFSNAQVERDIKDLERYV